MIIVHQDRDDLGLGGLDASGKVVDEKIRAESLKTGNAGKRVGCGVIGLRESPKGCVMKSEESNSKISQ